MHLHTDLKGLRIACIRSLGFSGFFQYIELANISASHIHYEHVCIFIPFAKNDIYREGNYVYIKKLGNEYCPCSECFTTNTEVTNAYSEPNLPIFRPLRFFRSSNLFRIVWSKTFIYKMPGNIQRMSTRTWIRWKEIWITQFEIRWQVELQQQPIMGMLQNDNWSYMDAGKLILRRTCMCTKMLRTDCLLLRILDFRYSIRNTDS
jgi:hypothetical protein